MKLLLFFSFCILSYNALAQMSITQHPNDYSKFGRLGVYNNSTLIDNMNNSVNVQRNNEAMQQEDMRNFRQRELQEELLMRRRNIVLPDFRGQDGTECFFNVKNEIEKALKGEKSLSIKDAVFLFENAFYGNSLNHTKYENEIANLKRFCTVKMREEKLNQNDNMAKLMMIFRVMTDKVTIKESGTEKKITHYPIKYDFENYDGNKNFENTFVSKLLITNMGQCSSIPKLFLILAEELNAEAYLSQSPNHSFVKFKDNTGKWYNAELTSGVLASDDFYMNSGFVKAEAIRNGIYLSTLTKEQVLAQILSETAQAYARRYGYDLFVKDALETVLKYYPNCISAHLELSNYITASALYVLDRSGCPSVELLHFYPQAHRWYYKMLAYYAKVDSLGYEKIPDKVYNEWLRQTEKAKEMPENKPSIFKQTRK